LSGAEKETKFSLQLLKSLGVDIELPHIIINVGEIFMSENSSATSRTRDVDTQYDF
jgi:hypothetical protein